MHKYLLKQTTAFLLSCTFLLTPIFSAQADRAADFHHEIIEVLKSNIHDIIDQVPLFEEEQKQQIVDVINILMDGSSFQDPLVGDKLWDITEYGFRNPMDGTEPLPESDIQTYKRLWDAWYADPNIKKQDMEAMAVVILNILEEMEKEIAGTELAGATGIYDGYANLIIKYYLDVDPNGIDQSQYNDPIQVMLDNMNTLIARTGIHDLPPVVTEQIEALEEAQAMGGIEALFMLGFRSGIGEDLSPFFPTDGMAPSNRFAVPDYSGGTGLIGPEDAPPGALVPQRNLRPSRVTPPSSTPERRSIQEYRRSRNYGRRPKPKVEEKSTSTFQYGGRYRRPGLRSFSR